MPELDAEIAFEVGLLLDQFDLLERQIEAADGRVARSSTASTARRLQTIPGVGPSTVATLLAEIGDIVRFTDFDQLLAYAGVHPADTLAEVNVTKRVTAGTFLTPSLRPGAVFNLHVSVDSATMKGNSRLITITSATSSTKKDAVKFVMRPERNAAAEHVHGSPT